MYSGQVYHGYNTYSNSNSIVGYSTSNIGYTTNVGRSTNFGYQANRYHYTTIQDIYRGTYHPNNTVSPGASRPRRITVYDGNGNSRETPGGNNDPEGVYQYDESTGIWYYSPDNGVTWYEYRSASGFWERFIGLFGGGWGNDWRSVNHEPTENTGKWASDPDDPFLDPVGDFTIELLVLLILGYAYYRKRKTVSE